MRGFGKILAASFLVSSAMLASGAVQAKSFEVLESFGGPKLGSNPQGPVLIDKDGNIFGTASQDGPKGGGTVFELKRVRHGYKASAIYRFCNVCAGKGPTGPLILDTQGNLYGTANNVVFELSPVAGQRRWAGKFLHQFCSNGCGDGNAPVGGLTYQGASSGALYDGVSPLFGVTAEGGANNGGMVFELNNNAGTWSESVLYSFCSQGGNNCTDGRQPLGGVLADNAGNIFGSTFEGGNNFQGVGAGVIYELSPSGDSWTETKLYAFCTIKVCADGALPVGNLALDGAGTLYGTTTAGGRKCKSGAWGCGVVFKLVPNGAKSEETVLYAFCKQRDCRDGSAPDAGLLIDSSASLNGTTFFGGGNDIDVNGLGGGVAFRLSGASYKVLHRFCSAENCADGNYPSAELIADSETHLFGTTSVGGALGNGDEGGTAFELKH